MQYDNDAKQIKYGVLKIVAKNKFEGTLDEHLEKIPYDVIPGPLPEFRCCIYREREIIRERRSQRRAIRCPVRPIVVLSACCPPPVRAALSVGLQLQTTVSAVLRKSARPPAPLVPFLLRAAVHTSTPTSAGVRPLCRGLSL